MKFFCYDKQIAKQNGLKERRYRLLFVYLFNLFLFLFVWKFFIPNIYLLAFIFFISILILLICRYDILFTKYPELIAYSVDSNGKVNIFDFYNNYFSGGARKLEDIANDYNNPEYIQKMIDTNGNNLKCHILELKKVYSIEEKPCYYIIKCDYERINCRGIDSKPYKKNETMILYKSYNDLDALLGVLNNKKNTSL